MRNSFKLSALALAAVLASTAAFAGPTDVHLHAQNPLQFNESSQGALAVPNNGAVESSRDYYSKHSSRVYTPDSISGQTEDRAVGNVNAP